MTQHPPEANPGSPGGGPRRQLLLAVLGCWALLFGMGTVMLGNGLQGSLLGLRATFEGFSSLVTGIVMSGYFVGFAIGSTVAPRLVRRVGHVRVFAALASLASIAALLHLLYVAPVAWTAMRIITGFSYAGIYVVAESWLNERSTNETRGQLLSVYMVVMLAGVAGGPLLLNLADPASFELFVVASVLVSVALVPILLTVGPTPKFDAPAKVGVVELYRSAPLGVAGCFTTGVSNGALIGLGAVYGESIGFSIVEISLFMSLGLVGGVLLQGPIGFLSDRLDRRVVLTGVTFGAAVTAGAAVVLVASPTVVVLALVTLFGGFSFPLYSLSLAHTNDRLRPEQMVAASGSLVLATGIGGVFGPLLAGAAMSAFGAAGFFSFLLVAHVLLGLFALYRMRQRAPAEHQEQAAAIYMTQSSQVATASAFEGQGETED